MKFHNKPYTFVELVELKVTNLENSLTFYQEVVGFKVLEKTATKALLTADGQTALLSIEQPTDIIPSTTKNDRLVPLCTITSYS